MVQTGQAVMSVNHVGTYERTQLTGGAITDGTYVLTEVTDYVEPGHVDGETRPYGRDTFTVVGGVIDDVFDFPDGDTARFTATFMENGSELHMTTSCTWSRVQNAWTPLYDWLPLTQPLDGSYGATPTSITIWTPRGNHESILRVFTKLP